MEGSTCCPVKTLVAAVETDSALGLGDAVPTLLLLLGICREDMSNGANMSEGLGDCPAANSPTLLLFLPVLEGGACRDAEE